MYEQFLKINFPDLVDIDNPTPIIVIAHEFFDALPIHQFQY